MHSTTLTIEQKRTLGEQIVALHHLIENVQNKHVYLQQEEISAIFARSIQLLQNTHTLLMQDSKDFCYQGLHALANKIHQEVIVYMRSYYWNTPALSNSDIENLIFQELSLASLANCASINKHWNLAISTYLSQITRKQCVELSGFRLSILDVEQLEFITNSGLIEPIIVEPKSNFLHLLKQVMILSPQVENDQGLTLLTMPKGLTLNKLVQIAANHGMLLNVVSGWNTDLLRGVPVGETYQILISNSLFLDTRKHSVQEQNCIVEALGCRMPYLLEYCLLCVATQIVYQKQLYGNREDTSPICGVMLPKLGHDYLVIWSVAPSSLHIYPLQDAAIKSSGVGSGGSMILDNSFQAFIDLNVYKVKPYSK